MAEATHNQFYEDYVAPRLPKADDRVNYTAASENASSRCGNCRFYGWGTCQLVEGTIEADDVCDLHLSAPRLSPDMAFAEPASLHPARGVGKNGQVFHDHRRPLTFTGASEWVQFLPPPGTYQHVVYGELQLTTETYKHIAENFSSGVYGQTLPINCEHDGPATGAIGYIADMQIASDGSIEVKPEWNERGTSPIEGDRFRYVSAEFFEQWQDPVTGAWHDDVAFGMAICTNPHFKETVLRPLAATERRSLIHHTPAQHREGEPGMTDPQKDKLEVNPGTQNTVTLSEEEAQRFRELPGRLEAVEQERDQARDQATRLTERVATMEQEARRQRFSDLVAGRGGANDGLAWFGDPVKHVALLETLAGQFGEDGDEVRNYAEQQQGIASQLKDSKLFTEIGSSQSGESDTDAQITAKVEELRKTNANLTIEQAEAQVYNEHPDLYEAAMKGGN